MHSLHADLFKLLTFRVDVTPYFAAVFQLLETDANRPLQFFDVVHHVRNMHRPFLLDDSGTLVRVRGALVTLHEIHPFDNDSTALRNEAQNLSGLPFDDLLFLAVSTDKHEHGITFAEIRREDVLFANSRRTKLLRH